MLKVTMGASQLEAAIDLVVAVLIQIKGLILNSMVRTQIQGWVVDLMQM